MVRSSRELRGEALYPSRYSKHENETTRTLIKAYGINFVVLVQCRAGKTSLVSIALTLGSGLGLLVVVSRK